MSMSKHMKRSGVVAWCPHKEHSDLLACGTAAGSISDFGASAAQLEIFTLTTSDAQDRTMPVLGTTEVNERFHCLAWGKGTSPYGLIAGGMANGSVLVANPGSIAKGEKDTIFSVTEKHSGPVQGLDFNPNQPNLLASGGAEAEINIWDVTSPSAPKNYTPGAKAQQQTDITCLQWNPTVAHILASAAYNGVSVIWDLRAKRPVITFSDPSKKTKCRAMAWNPVEPMQIVTASEEDSSPVIQVWDLRNTYSPSKYLEGHTKGIWSLSWCPLDPGLLLSCGKHTEVFCWNMQTGKVQCEVETTNSWNSNVQWAPHIPSMFSICSLEGQIKVFSLQDPTPRIMGGGSTRHVDFSHPPKWLKKPAGASFGFGGKLFSFSQKTGPTVNVRTLVTDPEFVSRADRLEKVIESGEFKHFCEEKAQEAALPRDKQMWSLMKVLFETDARSSLLAELEYGAEAIKQHIAEVLANMPEPTTETKDATPPSSKGKEKDEVEKVKEEEAKPQEPVNDVFSEQEEKKELDETPQDEPIPFGEKGGDVSDFFGGGFGGQATFNVGSATEGEGDLFANLGNAPAADDPFAALAAQAVQQQHEPAVQPITHTERTDLAHKLVEPIEFDTSNSQDTESLITRALVVGKFDLAVDLCIKSARMADALVLAACGGPDLWARTQDRYFKQNRAPYMRLVASIVKDRLQDLVAQTKLRSWKGTLAVVCTYAKSDEFPVLCDFLGDRLMEEAGDSDSAVLCYMCAGNIEKTVAAWAKQAVGSRQGEGVAALVDLLEKVNIFRKAIDFKDVTEVLAVKYSQYAEALAAQGQLPAAMKYLAFLSDPKFDTLTGRDGAVLLDRVYHALGARGPAPPTPFAREEVHPDQRLLYGQQQQQQPVPSTPTQPTYSGPSAGTQTRNFGGPAGPSSHMGGAPSHMGGGAPSHMGGGAPSHMGGGAPSHMGSGAPSHMGGGAPSHMGSGAPSHMGGAPSHMGGGHPSSFGHSGGAPSHLGGHPSAVGGGGVPSHMGGGAASHLGGPPSAFGSSHFGGHPSTTTPSPFLSGGGAPSHMGGGVGGGHPPPAFGGAPSHMGGGASGGHPPSAFGGAPSHTGGGASGGHPSFVGGAGAPPHPSYVGGGAAAPPVGPPPAGSPSFGSGPSSFPTPTAHTGGFGGSPAPPMGGSVTAPPPSGAPLSREKTPPASLERPVGDKAGPSIPSNTHLKTKEEKPAGSGQPTAAGTEAMNKYGSLIDTFNVQFSSDPRKGKMVHDARTRLEPLFNKLRNGELSNGAETTLVQLASALEMGDKVTAHALHKEASGKYWEELTSPVMIGLKRLIDVL